MYATVEDMRREGVSEAIASDDRLLELIDEATQQIDNVTGWFFEPRPMTLFLDGRGVSSLDLPVPCIRLDRLTLGGFEVELPDGVEIFVTPLRPGFDGPRIVLRGGVFPRGRSNIAVEGLFGFTEPDSTAEGRTPREICRACILIVLRSLHPMASAAAADSRNRWRVIEERTRDQSYRLESMKGSAVSVTGDPEIDRILARYRRPPQIGAA